MHGKHRLSTLVPLYLKTTGQLRRRTTANPYIEFAPFSILSRSRLALPKPQRGAAVAQTFAARFDFHLARAARAA